MIIFLKIIFPRFFHIWMRIKCTSRSTTGHFIVRQLEVYHSFICIRLIQVMNVEYFIGKIFTQNQSFSFPCKPRIFFAFTVVHLYISEVYILSIALVVIGKYLNRQLVLLFIPPCCLSNIVKLHLLLHR